MQREIVEVIPLLDEILLRLGMDPAVSHLMAVGTSPLTLLCTCVSSFLAHRKLGSMRGDILPEKTVCFGDNLNDLTLLQFTPHSVAMGNARQELKDAAAYVCRSNHVDGLARFLEEHVL